MPDRNPSSPMRAASGAKAKNRTSVPVDRFRKAAFPNRLRELRIEAGHPTLVGFAASISDIPYIRLSKIERGEVFARAAELRRVAAALNVSPQALLIDIDSQQFDVERWASPFSIEEDAGETELAMLLAAAFRQRRSVDAGLTLAKLESEYGLPPVIVSRIENAAKPVGRWNDQTLRSICAVVGVTDPEHLESRLRELHAEGTLEEALAKIPGRAEREERTRERVAALRHELAQEPKGALDETSVPQPAAEMPSMRMLPIVGAPLADGLVADVPTDQKVEAPSMAGPRAYALRIFRSTLGPGLPANTILIVDPDRFPTPGGLTVIREKGGLRVLAISVDRSGAMVGISANPDLSIAIDELPPVDVAAVIGARF